MSAENPRYYKYYPQKVLDLGTMPFEGDFTTNDRIVQYDVAGMQTVYYPNASKTEWGRTVATKDARGRIRQVWTPGVTIGPVTYQGTPMPVWFIYFGDGVCTVKLPNGDQPEPYDPTNDGE